MENTKQGKKISLYVSKGNITMCERLQRYAQKENKSLSSMISDNLDRICMQEFANIRLSVGACLALADNRFDLLKYTKLDNGVAVITVKEDALKYKDGSKGIYADKMIEWVDECKNE